MNVALSSGSKRGLVISVCACAHKKVAAFVGDLLLSEASFYCKANCVQRWSRRRPCTKVEGCFCRENLIERRGIVDVPIHVVA